MSINTEINKAVKTTVDQAISKAGFDRTRVGQIVGVNLNNTYSVRVDTIVYPNVPVYGENHFSSGDLVKVIYPCNQVSQMYIDGYGGGGNTSLSWGTLSGNAIPLQVMNENGTTSSVTLTGGDNVTLSSSSSSNLTISATGGEGITIDTVPIGTIAEWGATTPPNNWLLLNGQAVSRVTYSELFSLYGTTYGAGDGSTTFNLPDFRGRAGVGLSDGDSDFGTLGQTGGEKTHVITTAEMAAHTHGRISLTGNFWNYRGQDATYTGNANGIFSMGNVDSSAPYGTGGMASGKPDALHVDASHTHSSVGSNSAHNNLQPYITTNYIVKAKSLQTVSMENLSIENLTVQNLTTTNSTLAQNVTSNSGTSVGTSITSLPLITSKYITSDSTATGQLIITLPQGYVGAMVRFTVEIMQHYGSQLGDYNIFGQIQRGGYWSQNTICKVESATTDSSTYDGFNNLPVQVGAENGKCQVVIGNADTVWQSYTAIRVKDFAAYFAQSDISKWTSGWNIEIGVATGTYADITNYHYLDYIVERGTEAVNVSGYCNGDWEYTIYNSGRIEAYYNGYLTLTTGATTVKVPTVINNIYNTAINLRSVIIIGGGLYRGTLRKAGMDVVCGGWSTDTVGGAGFTVYVRVAGSVPPDGQYAVCLSLIIPETLLNV